MKIALTSDSHYGCSRNTESLLRDMLGSLQLENPDVILHAGDWASTSVSEFAACVKLFRDYFPSTPIVGCLGNHDQWSQPIEMAEFSSIDEHIAHNHKVMTDHNILTSYMDLSQGISISAMQSWYRTARPPSNDEYYMVGGRESHYTMMNHAQADYTRVLQHVKEFPTFKHVVISHFSPYNYRYGYTGMCGPLAPFEDLITSGVKYIYLGHSHEYQNEQVDECTILNAGPDYDEPKFITFEI